MPKFSRILITVGTTKFDQLIEIVNTKEFQSFIQKQYGCEYLAIQIGRGEIEPKAKVSNLTVETYRFKTDIADDIKQADLIISHCGAGSIMDVMKAGKPLIAVINDKLMDNHQNELADAMVQEGPYLFAVVSPGHLVREMEKMNFSKLRSFSGIDFSPILNNVISYFDL